MAAPRFGRWLQAPQLVVDRVAARLLERGIGADLDHGIDKIAIAAHLTGLAEVCEEEASKLECLASDLEPPTRTCTERLAQSANS